MQTKTHIRHEWITQNLIKLFSLTPPIGVWARMSTAERREYLKSLIDNRGFSDYTIRSLEYQIGLAIKWKTKGYCKSRIEEYVKVIGPALLGGFIKPYDLNNSLNNIR